jgi:hypothetical protein
MSNVNSVVGGGLPAGVPRERPAWFDSDEQYEAFLKSTADEIGPQCITASSIDVEHLDEDARRALLGGYALRPTLEFVCRIFAQWDDAALSSRMGAFEKQLMRRLTGDLAVKVNPQVKRGCVAMPPAALTQLIREVIEWCDTTEVISAVVDGELKPLGLNDFICLVLSINGDQERQGMPDRFASWPPTDAELEKYYAEMTVDDDLVLSEMKRRMVSDLARMQAHAVMVPDLVLGDTFDTWFKAWPSAAPHDLIGGTPEDAFRAATDVSLREAIKLGLRLWEQTKNGEVTFTLSGMVTEVDAQALDVMRDAASLTVIEYRKRRARERKKGDLAHRRYTFTERPLIRFEDGEYLAIRPAWVLDRFCGSQLYWQTFFDFGTEKDLRGEQFSQAMNYVFEAGVGYLFRRVSRRAGSAITLITEEEMQQAWSGKNTPSVCDWVLVSGRYCLLVDATNHWLDEKAAQGFADVEDYTADIEETFVNKKFLQLRSTIELLARNGWADCDFNDEMVYIPMVIVPNSGIPPAVMADVDIKLRAHSVLGQLGKIVTSPGILIYRDLQVLEGVCEHRVPKAFVDLIARWRVLCTQTMPVNPQHFLDLCGVDRPMSTYPRLARSMLMKRL